MVPVPDKFMHALARRAKVRTPDTDCLRLLDGQGDGFPDLFVDDLAGRWLVQTRGDNLPAWAASLVDLPDAGKPRSVYWKRLDQSNKEPPKHVAGEPVAEPFLVRENGLGFWIDFAAGYSQGLFLDQRPNRRRIRDAARPGRELLNLFSYTCGFSVCHAAAGGHSVSVDLSKPALDWGRRNFEANGLDPQQHEFIAGEAADWLKRFGKKGRRFDAIVLDPPTFSRDKKGKVFRVERDFGTLAGAAMAVLKPGGTLLCTTNQRTLSRGAFSSLILSGSNDPGRWKLTFGDMPPDFTGEAYLKVCWVSRR
ncbi:MAG TPA: class I SAM-dependent methyltransferase [Humisphaera sp.]